MFGEDEEDDMLESTIPLVNDSFQLSAFDSYFSFLSFPFFQINLSAMFFQCACSVLADGSCADLDLMID